MFNGSSTFSTMGSYSNGNNFGTAGNIFGLYLYNRLLIVTHLRDETLPL